MKHDMKHDLAPDLATVLQPIATAKGLPNRHYIDPAYKYLLSHHHCRDSSLHHPSIRHAPVPLFTLHWITFPSAEPL